MISLKQLQIFASIARHGNLGEAADEICLSKGAISQSLGELERRLGTPVFDRIHPRLKLNDQGRALQPLAEDLLGRADDIMHMFDQGGETLGPVRVGASQTIGNYLLPRLLAHNPGLDVRLHITNTRALCDMLSHFELDLALIEGQNHDPSLETQPWLEDEMLIAAAPDHPLASRPRVDIEMLDGQNWLVREPNSGSREQFDLDLAPLLGQMGTMRIINAPEAIMLGVEEGLGLTMISRLAAQDRLASGRLAQIKLMRKFTRQLSLVWHKQKYHSAPMRSFIHLCKSEAAPKVCAVFG